MQGLLVDGRRGHGVHFAGVGELNGFGDVVVGRPAAHAADFAVREFPHVDVVEVDEVEHAAAVVAFGGFGDASDGEGGTRYFDGLLHDLAVADDDHVSGLEGLVRT